jgi:hypothetical protein
MFYKSHRSITLQMRNAYCKTHTNDKSMRCRSSQHRHSRAFFLHPHGDPPIPFTKETSRRTNSKDSKAQRLSVLWLLGWPRDREEVEQSDLESRTAREIGLISEVLT